MNGKLKRQYRMPAEFEQHDRCWMLWPHRGDVWRENAMPVQQVFASVAEVIASSEPVTMGVAPNQLDIAKSMLSNLIDIVEIDSNDAWIRDVGPTFVDNNGFLSALDWCFNAWGGRECGLYYPWDKDSLVAQKIAKIVNCRHVDVPLVLEGGAIHTDGEGTLLVTEECVLNANRNPNLSKLQIEELLKKFLGIDMIIWLSKGLFNDETGGHIDNFCCFVRPGTVALHWCDNESDPQYSRSQHALNVLQNSRDAQGRKFEIIKLPQPGPLYITALEARGIERSGTSKKRVEGERLAASYINFYIGNSVVVFPHLDERYDHQVKNILSTVFSDKHIIGIPQAREILLGGGNIHCITQQQPVINNQG